MGAHNVRFHRTGHKSLHHPTVGRLDLEFEAMEFPARPGLTVLVYTAPAGTPPRTDSNYSRAWPPPPTGPTTTPPRNDEH